MKKLFILALFLWAVPAWSQTSVNGRVSTGINVLKPASCGAGDQYNTVDTFQAFMCGPDNTWVLIAGVSSGITGLTPNFLSKAASSTSITNSSVTDDGINPVNSPNGIDVATNSYDVDIANNAVTGTVVNLLACGDGTGKAIICSHTTSTTNQALGTVIAGAGTSGKATICAMGFCSVKFDNQSTALDYAIASPTIDGELHDVGPTLTSGQPNYLVWTANAGAGTISQYRLLIGDDFITGATQANTFGPPPVSPNITFLACDAVSGGIANTKFCWPGTPGRTVSGASDTILSTDRAGCVLYTNGGAVAVAISQAGTTNFANNFPFCVKAATTTVLTLTPTTSTIAGNNGTLAATLVVPASSTAYCYSWDNTNYQCTVVTGITTTTCTNQVVSAISSAGTVTCHTVVGADMASGTVGATQLVSQYSQWLVCDGKGIGDGLNAMAAGTYLMSTCRNTTGVTVTITGIKCFTDNSGSSTLNVAGNTLGALLTGAVTCTSSYASGTQSANVLLTANDYIKFTFVADGTSKQTDWVVTGTF